MTPIFSLAGKIALVTGAGQGAGAGIAALFARQGAAIIINDVVAERAEAQAQAIRQAGGKAIAQAFDVTDLEAVRQGIAAGEAGIGGPVDILVNNAGNGGADGPLHMLPFADLPPEHWQATLAVNIYGAMNCLHVVLKPMISRGCSKHQSLAAATCAITDLVRLPRFALLTQSPSSPPVEFAAG